MAWYESPQYLKGIQKIRSMNPGDKAVTQVLVNEWDGLWGGKESEKQLQAMRIASGVRGQEGSLALSRRDLDLSHKNVDFMKDSADTAEMLGYANIGLSGFMGYQDMRQKKKYAKIFEDFAKKYRS